MVELTELNLVRDKKFFRDIVKLSKEILVNLNNKSDNEGQFSIIEGNYKPLYCLVCVLKSNFLDVQIYKDNYNLAYNWKAIIFFKWQEGAEEKWKRIMVKFGGEEFYNEKEFEEGRNKAMSLILNFM